MKTPINIAKYLRIFFGVARALTIILPAIVLIGYSTMALINLKSANPTYLRIQLPILHLKLSNGAVTIKTETSDANDIRVETLVSTLSINTKSKDKELATRAQWAMYPAYVFNFTYYFLLFGFLRRLCANIEAGDVFNDANLCLVRNIGWLFIICVSVENSLSIMTHYVIVSYLNQHTTVTGLNATLDSGILQQLQLSHLITGLLVLLIAEAFRQGLALKKENDLVV